MSEEPHSRVAATSRVAESSIRTIAELQRDFERRQLSLRDRIADELGRLVGSFRFIGLQLVVLALWLSINVGALPIAPPFDPPPFPILALALGVEAIVLLSIVVMRENRMRRLAEQRDQLELQVNLLAERKTTEILQTIPRISEELGLERAAEGEETTRLSQETHLQTLARDLEDEIQAKE